MPKTNQGSLGIAQPPRLLEPEPQGHFISRRFRQLPAVNHHDSALNSSCSNANPARQVAARNGMVCSTNEEHWLSGLLPLPSPSVTIGG